MSMFERASTGSAWTDSDDEELNFPDDFSREEATFARELRDIFAPEREDLPPLYIPTLIDHEWHTSIESAFEQKLTCRVFHRLRLPYGRQTKNRRGFRRRNRHDVVDFLV